MSVIDGNTDTVSATVMVGNFPGPVAVDPVTNMVYVTNYLRQPTWLQAESRPGDGQCHRWRDQHGYEHGYGR